MNSSVHVQTAEEVKTNVGIIPVLVNKDFLHRKSKDKS